MFSFRSRDGLRRRLVMTTRDERDQDIKYKYGSQHTRQRPIKTGVVAHGYQVWRSP